MTPRLSKHGFAVPSVHLNGTGKATLCANLQNACAALHAAHDALVENVEPHGRDYYVQDAPGTPLGGGAYLLAREQHLERLARLKKLHAELFEIWEAVDEQGQSA